MPTNTITLLYGPNYLGTTAASLKSGSSAGTMIKYMTIVNSGASTETVELYINTTTPSANHLIQKLILSAGDSASFDGTLIIPSGSNLYGKTTNTSSVVISIHGMDMT